MRTDKWILDFFYADYVMETCSFFFFSVSHILFEQPRIRYFSSYANLYIRMII